MKSAIVFILPIFLFVAIFGFALMCEHSLANHHSAASHTSQVGCFLEMMSQCGSTAASMALSHISAYQSFFNAKVSTFFLGYSLLFVLFVAAWTYLDRNLLVYKRSLVFSYMHRRTDITPLRTQKYLKWISLFENSPTYR